MIMLQNIVNVQPLGSLQVEFVSAGIRMLIWSITPSVALVHDALRRVGLRLLDCVLRRAIKAFDSSVFH